MTTPFISHFGRVQTLSSLEIGDIYLSSIKMAEGGGNIRKLTFLEFWEATVRCALVAYVEIGFWGEKRVCVYYKYSSTIQCTLRKNTETWQP